MNHRDELRDLFRRTLPHDDDIVVALARVRARKREHRTDLRTRSVAVALAAACAFVFAIIAIALVPRATQPWVVTAEPPPTSSTLRTSVVLREPTSTPAVSPAATSVSPRVALSVAAPQRPAVMQSSVSTAGAAPGSTAVPESSASAETPRHAPAASWEAVASALRSGETAKADQLLATLAKSADPQVRDSALLVQVRSRVSTARAQSKALDASDLQVLQRLATEGSTSSIRASARKLLSERQ